MRILIIITTIIVSLLPDSSALPESSTVLSFQQSPSLKTMKIEEEDQKLEGMELNIEIDDPHQESGSESGHIYVTALLGEGDVRHMEIPVTVGSTQKQTLCLNPFPKDVKEFKVILISDMNSVKNITMKVSESTCTFSEPSSDCVVTTAVTVIVTVILCLVLAVAIVYLFVRKCKERIPKWIITNNEASDNEMQSLKPSEDNLSSRSVIKDSSKGNMDSTNDLIHAEITIEMDKKEGGVKTGDKSMVLRTETDQAKAKLEGFFKNWNLKTKDLTFRSFDSQKSVRIFSFCAVDGQLKEERNSFNKLKELLTIDVKQMKEMLATKIRIAIDNSDKEAAEHELEDILKELFIYPDIQFDKMYDSNAKKKSIPSFIVYIPDNKKPILEKTLKEKSILNMILK